MRPFLICVMCCGLALPAHAFIRMRLNESTVTRRADFTDIQFLVHDGTAAGLTNTQGTVNITADSDPIGALQAAMDSWTNVSSSAVRFAALGRTALDTPANDNQHIITFADNPTNRSIVGDALVVAVTRLRFLSNGQITDTDLVFSPSLTFSTTLQAGSLDLQSVATHELGHALGAGHSGVLGATMYARTSRASNIQATLTADDIAFVTEVYPEAGAAGGLGAISGTVNLNGGGPVAGALVTAIDPSTGNAIGSATGSDGAYRISSMPPGRYFVYAEPMDGPVSLDQVRDALTTANTSFNTTVLGGAATPQGISVTAGGTATADFSVDGGSPALNLQQGGSAAPRASIPISANPFALRAGDTMDIGLVGAGLADPGISESSISFLGAPITVQTGTLQRLTSGGTPALRFSVQVAAGAPAGLATILVRSATAAAVYSGGAKVLPPAPAFSAAGVVSAASFVAGNAAPGEIVSIFGTGLGPAQGISGALDGTGHLGNSVAGVTVRIGGVLAPLFYVSQGQINAQVPLEASGRSAADVVVSYQGAASQAVTISIGAARPGIFMRAGSTQSIVQNQNGTLNEPGNPADRGQVVVIYGTGPGLTDPPVETGQLASATALSRTVTSPTVTFGGFPGEVIFSGLTPSFVGLWQVNAVIPPNAPAGSSIALAVRLGSASSQPNVTLAIR